MSVLLSQCRITERHQEFLARTQDGNKRTTKTTQKNFKWSKHRKPHDNSEPSGIICLNRAVKSLLSSSKYGRHSHTTYMIPCLSPRGFFFPTAFRLFPYLFPLTPSEAPRIFYVLGREQNMAKHDEFLCRHCMMEISTSPRTLQERQSRLFFSGPILSHSFTSLT